MPDGELTMRIRSVRYADVAATLALVLALGGTGAYAAQNIPRHSVGTRQLAKSAVVSKTIKDGSVKGKDLADGSVTVGKLAPDSVTVADLAGADAFNGTFTLSNLAPSSCSPIALTTPGAAVGDAIYLSMLTAPPANVMFGPLHVLAPNAVEGFVCNEGTTTVNYQGLIRVLTLR